MSRGRIQAVIVTTVAVWVALLFLQGVDLRLSYLRPYSLVVSIVLLAFYAFDRWLWQVQPIPRLLGRPVLAGTWKGELRSDWKGEPPGEVIQPILAFLAIRQTYDSLTIRLLTAESFSRSQTAELQRSADGVPEVITTYQNIPELLLRERSPVHFGAMRLEVHGQPGSRLEGYYWTDRDTKGQVVFTGHVSTIYSDFDSARTAMTGVPTVKP